MRPKRVSVGGIGAGAAAFSISRSASSASSVLDHPFNLAIVPCAALAAGKRVMLKPSQLTPRTSDLSGRSARRPVRSIRSRPSLVGPEVGQAFARPPFDHLLYTADGRGRLVMQAAPRNSTE